MRLLVKSEFFEVWVEGETDQDVIRQASFWSSLPTTCPVDDAPVKFGYAKRKGYDFYYLESTGPKRYEYSIGERREDNKLFPGEYEREEGKTYLRWRYWNGKESVVVWEDGKLLTTPVAKPVPNGTVELTPHQKLVLEFDRLGMEIYNVKWPEVRAHNTKRVSQGLMDDAAKLADEHLQRLIDGLKSVIAKGGK